MSEQKIIQFLFCNDPLHPRRVEESYREEYQAAHVSYPCALFSYEDLENGKLTLYGDQISGLTIYRGWMTSPELYQKFYDLLKQENIIMISSPREYCKYHLLPGWYRVFEVFTAKSVWEDQGTLESAMDMCKGLEGSYIVKDYVKSRKHEWFDACFIPDIADRDHASEVISNFIQRQESSLVGGVVLRKFEKIRQIGFHEKSGMPISEEYRVFLYHGQILIMDDYWQKDTKLNLSQEEVNWVKELAKRITSPFVTMDLARREDGKLMIMELGDGQVSGLQQIDPVQFYAAFAGNNMAENL